MSRGDDHRLADIREAAGRLSDRLGEDDRVQPELLWQAAAVDIPVIVAALATERPPGAATGR